MRALLPTLVLPTLTPLPTLPTPFPTRHAPIAMTLSYEEKLAMVNAGLAVPGMSEEGAEASRKINKKLDELGIIEIGKSRPPPAEKKACTKDDPCEVDGELIKSLIFTPGPVILLVAFAYSVGSQAFADEDDEEWIAKLERRAEKSRERRLERQRNLASQLKPVEQWFGWTLVDDEGLPTTDAYVFLAAAVGAQLSLAFAVQQAFSGS